MLRTLLQYFFGPRGLPYTIFLLIGAGGLIYFVPIALAQRVGQPDPRYSLAVSVATSLFIIGLVEVAAKCLEILREGRNWPLFKVFFGANVRREAGVETVFLQAALPPFSPGTRPGLGGNITLSAPPDEAGATLPKGIAHIIPFEDLQAVLSIDRTFRKYGARLQMKLDTFKTDPLPEHGCIGIGLGYNNVTLRLMHLCPDLYRVTYDNPKGSNSDDVVLGNGEDGPTSDCDDYALIARVLLGTSKNPIPYMICAGHTAGATIVACEYLAEHWKKIALLYRYDPNNPKRLNEYSMAVFLRFKNDAKQKAFLGKPRFVPISS